MDPPFNNFKVGEENSEQCTIFISNLLRIVFQCPIVKIKTKMPVPTFLNYFLIVTVPSLHNLSLTLNRLGLRVRLKYHK